MCKIRKVISMLLTALMLFVLPISTGISNALAEGANGQSNSENPGLLFTVILGPGEVAEAYDGTEHPLMMKIQRVETYAVNNDGVLEPIEIDESKYEVAWDESVDFENWELFSKKEIGEYPWIAAEYEEEVKARITSGNFYKWKIILDEELEEQYSCATNYALEDGMLTIGEPQNLEDGMVLFTLILGPGEVAEAYDGTEHPLMMKLQRVETYLVKPGGVLEPIEIDESKYEVAWDESVDFDNWELFSKKEIGEYPWIAAEHEEEVKARITTGNLFKWRINLDEELEEHYRCATNYALEDGKLTIVDMETDGPAFITEQMNLGSKIGVVFYLRLPEINGFVYDRVDFTISGKDSDRFTQSVAYGEEVRDYNSLALNLYNFTFFETSIQMADQITATLHYTVNGEEKTLTRAPYALKEFFYKYDVNRAVYSEAMRNAIEAVADLGHYVQVLEQNKVIGSVVTPPWVLGEDHAEMDKFYHTYTSADIAAAKAELSEYAMTYELQNPNEKLPFRFKYAANFESATLLNLYFVPRAGNDFTSENITMVKIDGVDFTDKIVEDENGDGYRIDYAGGVHVGDRFPGIYSIELYRAYTIEVKGEYNGATYGFTASISPYSYMYDEIIYGESINNPHYVNFAVAAYRYGKYAREMFAELPID